MKLLSHWQDRLPRAPSPGKVIPLLFRDRTQERKDQETKAFPTFLFTIPLLHKGAKVVRDLERALTVGLQGGFTNWTASGAWNGPAGFEREDVSVYLVSTDKEDALRGIVKSILDILGEKEGYFVRVGEHTIL